jgi:3-deoxy-D-manno-octulosonate 8-phosphate phosphatase (KDO 8-P phosphatase)
MSVPHESDAALAQAAALDEAKARARNIKVILFDVDGVLTDGTIWVVPIGGVAKAKKSKPVDTAGDGGFGLQSDTMGEAKGFSAHDGMGVSLAKIAGLKVGFITKRVSEAVKTRARDLKLDYLYMGQAHKMQAVREIMEKSGVALDAIAYVGDDIVDLPVLRVCGLAIAPANARQEALDAAHYITPNPGGFGAGRDAIEFILNAKGILERVVEEYIDEDNPISAASDIGTGNM